MSLLYEEYSPWKGVHFLDRLKTVKNKGICSPVSIQIAPTNRCCSKCYYCYVKDNNRSGDILDAKVILKLLEEAKELGVKAVEITGGGEPLMHPDIWKIVSRISELGLDFGLITNGFNIDPDKVARATWIRFSIDSFNPDIYKKIRGVNISAILDLKSVRAICKKSNIVVGASCVVTPYNYNDLFNFAKTAKKMGFSNVCFKPVELKDRQVLSPRMDTIKREMQKAISLSDNHFKVFSLELDKPMHDSFEKSFPKCLQQYLAVFVGADGNIYPCCSLQGNRKLAFGNVYKDSFIKQWRSHKALKIKDCKISCFWENKNIFLNYITTDNPKHVNFM